MMGWEHSYDKGDEGINTEFWQVNILKSVHLEDQERNGRIT
jgi:hypothetical protein